MATVAVAEPAVADLDELIRGLSLPADARARVRHSLQRLGDFPRMGKPVGGRWEDRRYIIGPWSWLVIVYRFDQANDRVLVVAFLDGRSSTFSPAR